MTKLKFQQSDSAGPVAAYLKTSKGNIPFPSRAMTTTEANYMKRIEDLRKVSYTPPNHVFEVMKSFSEEDLGKLGNQKEMNRQKAMLKNYSHSYKNKFTVFRPVISKSTRISYKKNFALMQLQIETGVFDAITLQDPNRTSAPEEFEKTINRLREEFEDHVYRNPKVELLPVIDVSTKDTASFREKLLAVKNNGFKGMVLLNANPLTNFENYLEVLEFSRDNEIWIHGSDIDRNWTKNRKTSLPHLLQVFGIHSFALSMPRRYPLKPSQKTVHDQGLQRIKRFDGESLGNIPFTEHLERYGENINCYPSCPLCQNETTTSFYNKYHRLRCVPLMAKAHECWSSFFQFNRGREYIMNDDFRGYARDRYYLWQGFCKLFPNKSLSLF